MITRLSIFLRSWAWLAIVLPFAAGTAHAQATSSPTQVLDRVDAYGATRLIEMQFADKNRTSGFVDDGITGTAFVSCQLTSTDGLYCLDGKYLKQWLNPKHPTQFEILLRCDDPVLRLDTKKPNPCTSVTLDAKGGIWLAGRKANSHSLLKVLPKANGVCPTGFTALSLSPALCFREYASGRPPIIDASSIDGDAAAQFNPTCPTCANGAGVLALEERKRVVFYPDLAGATPKILVSGKSGWGLKEYESLQSATLLQIPGATTTSRYSYVIATTSYGRLLAFDTALGGTPFEVFKVPLGRPPGSVACNALAAQYGIRASDKTGRLYVTDRNYCQVSALQPAIGVNGRLASLTNVLEGANFLTLSTGTIAVDDPTVAAGINIDLEDCFDNCTIVEDANGQPAATMSAVQLGSVESGLTIFQVKRIPDCRYIPAVCQALLGVSNLVAAGVIVDPPGLGPTQQFLNVTPLLPREIRDQFDASGAPPNGLPALLISPQYRGQAANGYYFDAFFGVPQKGVVFRDTFQAELRVAALAGSELGCVIGQPRGTPVATLRRWDVATSVSEAWRGIDGRYVDMLVNTGCGSSLLTKKGWSLLSYNLEVAPDTSVGTTVYTADPLVFAKLVDKLYNDLEAARTQLACVDVDSGTGAASPPLSAADCATLASLWSAGRTKLNACLAQATLPMAGAYFDSRCGLFRAQLQLYQTTLVAMTPFGADPANRFGELEARVKVLLHVYSDRFVPSIPPYVYHHDDDD